MHIVFTLERYANGGVIDTVWGKDSKDGERKGQRHDSHICFIGGWDKCPVRLWRSTMMTHTDTSEPLQTQLPLAKRVCVCSSS